MEPTEEAFKRCWKEEFPGAVPPRLSCFAEGTVSSIKQCYTECQHRITTYKYKLKQEDFIRDYLWKLQHECFNFGDSNHSEVKLYSPSHDEKSTKWDFSGNVSGKNLDVKGENKAKKVKPLSLHDPVVHTSGQLEGELDQNNRASGNGPHIGGHPISLKTKEEDDSESFIGDSITFIQGTTVTGSAKGKEPSAAVLSPSRGDSVGNVKDSSGLEKPSPDSPVGIASTARNTFERLSQRNRPPVPLPRPSAKGPSFRGRSESPQEFLEGNPSSESPQDSPNMDAGTSSPLRRRRQPHHEYCEVEIPSARALSSNGDVGFAVATNEPVASRNSRFQRQAASRQRDYDMVNITFAPQSRDSLRSESPTGSEDGIVPPKVKGPPLLRPKGKPELTIADSGSSASGGSREPDFDDEAIRIYDNSPTDGGRLHTDDTSSDDDDEPIYYNLMLLKREAMEKAALNSSAIYASVDLEKKDFERQKRSQNQGIYEVPFDVTDSPPVPRKTVSLLSIKDTKKSLKSTDSVESSDSVFLDSPHGGAVANRWVEDDRWKKRASMRAATADNHSISSEEGEVGSTAGSAENEKLRMRHWVLTSIIDSEHAYIDMLDVLLQYMRSLEASAQSSQPVISSEEVKTIFFNIADLHRIHSRFVQDLEAQVDRDASSKSNVGEAFKILALEEYPLANDYCQNYQKATACLQRCSEEKQQFRHLVQEIKWKGSSESATLEEMLHKPVVRLQRNMLVLHDLIKCTPTSHADYDMLQKTMKITQNFLESFKSPMNAFNSEQPRYLVKNGMIVEMVSSRRKLRQVFLFNDVIVCAKQKLSRQRLHFECKWFIPLADLLLAATQTKEDSKMAVGQKEKVEKLKKKVSDLQAELRAELRKNRGQAEGRQWSMRGGRNLEKIRKKLTEQEVELFRESPNLTFRLCTKVKKEKPLTLLMSSDYERNDWRETIIGLQLKHNKAANACTDMTSMELQNLINSIQRPKINAIGAAVDDVAVEEEHMYGSLIVNVRRAQGLKGKADTFCCIEVDSYGHFFIKAKTNVICNSSDPQWNEEFEIDLDGSQTLRVLAYRVSGEADVLLGRGALELSKAWLKSSYQETVVSLNEEISLTLSLKYTSREQTLKRTPSSAKGGLFGVKISSITKRESRQVPLIVSTCVDEIEKRGIEDVGIYRISGLSSEIQRLKKAFERNVKGAIPLIRDSDTHVISGLLKLYFRELPEALFTDKIYPNLKEGMNLSDPDAKQRCMMSLLRSLPEPNYTTIVYLLEHLIRISKHEAKNKMSRNNLATVFGPTLLRPAVTNDEPMTMDLFSAGARDAMMQTSILCYYLSLMDAGVDFNKH